LTYAFAGKNVNKFDLRFGEKFGDLALDGVFSESMAKSPGFIRLAGFCCQKINEIQSTDQLPPLFAKGRVGTGARYSSFCYETDFNFLIYVVGNQRAGEFTAEL
jgi:hypothetical protein